MIDTHCHLDYPELLAELPAVLERAKLAGVYRYIIPGTTVTDSRAAIKLAAEYSTIYACVGVHPENAEKHMLADQEELEHLLQSHPEIVAVGEVGLDYYRLPEDALAISQTKAQQSILFSQMINLAKTYKKSLIIHTRNSFADAYAQLKSEPRDIPTVIHCFTGNWEEAKQWLDLGCTLSFTGIITYKKSVDLRQVVKQVPLDRLMLETDAPYLAPEGFRGKPSQPMHVRQVAECIAGIKNIQIEEVDRITTATAMKFFAI